MCHSTQSDIAKLVYHGYSVGRPYTCVSNAGILFKFALPDVFVMHCRSECIVGCYGLAGM